MGIINDKEITYENYLKMLHEGEKIVVPILRRLNLISFKHIRKDANCWRREEDAKELSILAVLIKNEKRVDS